MKKTLYFYKANVISVYDGDTITVDIDLGMKTVVKGEKIRLYRINAPEMRGVEKIRGRESRDFLRSIILGKEIFLETIKDKKGKYGRYLGEVHYEMSPGKFVVINDLMVKKGYAVYKDY